MLAILLRHVRANGFWLERISHLLRHFDPLLQRRGSWSSFTTHLKAHRPDCFEIVQRVNG